MTIRWLFPILTTLIALNACSSDRDVAPAERDLVAILKTRPSLTRFASALETTGVAEKLKADGDYTIFAPMDPVVGDAALNEATVRHHILGERVTFSDLAGESISYTTLHTDEIEVDATEAIRIGDALMVESDIEASNGVIHVIDKVLQPEDLPTRLGPVGSAGTGSIETDELPPPGNASGLVRSVGDGATAIIPAAPVVTQ